MVQRCLSLFINKFIIKNLTKKYMVRLYSSHTSRSISTRASVRYSFNNQNSYYLHPYYITGFVDGCFTTSIFPSKKKW